MDNRFAFGLWIYLDLTVIALGAGAFFTGFLLYILKKKELKAVINSAVVIGFICYSGAVGILMVDVGQPLRAWFTFWHPNVHSMLAEVTFCLTLYLSVLAIEYAPLVLKNRRLKEVPGAPRPRAPAPQGDGRLRRDRDAPLLLPPGLPRRALRRPARQPVRLPRAHRHLADDLLPLHPLGRRRRPELHPPDDLARREGLEEAPRLAGGLPDAREDLGLAAPRLRRPEGDRLPRLDQRDEPEDRRPGRRPSTRTRPSAPGSSSPRSSSSASSRRSSSSRGASARGRGSSSWPPRWPARASS